jgi:hypothetical protein
MGIDDGPEVFNGSPLAGVGVDDSKPPTPRSKAVGAGERERRDSPTLGNPDAAEQSFVSGPCGSA